jgi:hypothetical protein
MLTERSLVVDSLGHLRSSFNSTSRDVYLKYDMKKYSSFSQKISVEEFFVESREIVLKMIYPYMGIKGVV